MKKPKLSILAIHLSAGGAEKVISLFLKPLSRDFDVTLVLLADNIHFEVPAEVTVKCLFPGEMAKNTSTIHKMKMGILSMFRYRSFIKKEGIETSLSFLALPNFINGFVAMTTRGVRTIISERCFPSQMYALKRMSLRIAKWFYPLLYNRCDVLFSNSIHINDDLTNNFGIRIPMHVIYNPVELPVSWPMETYSGNGDFKLIHVGSMTPAKNQQMILNAMAGTDPGVALTLVGDGPLRHELETLIKTNGLEKRVELTGRVKDVNRYLSRHHCFVLASKTEGFPNVLLEAMAMGLPVIAANCQSGPLEILNENQKVLIDTGDFYCAKFGVLIKVDDVEGLISAIQYIMKNPDSQKQYSRLSLERAGHYSVEAMYASLKSLIILPHVRN